MKINSKYLYCINCSEIKLCEETYVEEETNIRGFKLKEKYPKYFCTVCNNEVHDRLSYDYMIVSSHDQMVCQVRDMYKQRIDKAIEYLETSTIDPQSMRHYRNCLLEILKGDNNE